LIITITGIFKADQITVGNNLTTAVFKRINTDGVERGATGVKDILSIREAILQA